MPDTLCGSNLYIPLCLNIQTHNSVTARRYAHLMYARVYVCKKYSKTGIHYEHTVNYS